jgi:hypothetical protein
LAPVVLGPGVNAIAARAAAVLTVLPGLLFGLPGGYGTWYFATRGEIWYLVGYPTYGDGPFEAAGLSTSVPLLAAFLGVCAAEVLVGWQLWRRRPGATAGAWALLPFELAFWIGFALPFGFAFGAARAAVLLAARCGARS